MAALRPGQPLGRRTLAIVVIALAVLGIALLLALPRLYHQVAPVQVPPPQGWDSVSKTRTGAWLGTNPYGTSRVAGSANLDDSKASHGLGETGTWVAYAQRDGENVVTVSSFTDSPIHEHWATKLSECQAGDCAQVTRVVSTPLGDGVLREPKGAWELIIPTDKDLIVVGTVGGPSPDQVISDLARR